MANNKGTFHFYKVISEIDLSIFFDGIYQEFMNSTYLPTDYDNNRYKVYEIQKLDVPIKIIFGNFYKYYEEEDKTIENQGETRLNAEFYPFLFLVEHGIFLLQHKAGYGDKHSIGTVVNDFITYISNSLKSIGIEGGIQKIEIRRDQKDLLRFFFDKTNTIKKVEAEQFSFRKFQENKELNIYTYFNPRASEEDAVTQTEDYFINNTKKISVEGNENKSLGKVPPVRIAVASAEQIKVVEGKTQDNRIFHYTPHTRKIECNIKDKLDNSNVLIVAAEFLKYFSGDDSSIEFNNNVEDDFIDKGLFEGMEI